MTPTRTTKEKYFTTISALERFFSSMNISMIIQRLHSGVPLITKFAFKRSLMRRHVPVQIMRIQKFIFADGTLVQFVFRVRLLVRFEFVFVSESFVASAAFETVSVDVAV